MSGVRVSASRKSRRSSGASRLRDSAVPPDPRRKRNRQVNLEYVDLSVFAGDGSASWCSAGFERGHESRIGHESDFFLAHHHCRAKQDVTVGVFGHEVAGVFRPADALKLVRRRASSSTRVSFAGVMACIANQNTICNILPKCATWLCDVL